jgi:hypothetical protein
MANQRSGLKLCNNKPIEKDYVWYLTFSCLSDLSPALTHLLFIKLIDKFGSGCLVRQRITHHKFKWKK